MDADPTAGAQTDPGQPNPGQPNPGHANPGQTAQAAESVPVAVGAPFAQRRAVGLLIVGCLAGLAGAVDAAGIARLQDLYVSFMSGNSTALGVAIAQADWPRVRLVAEILGLFVTGAAMGEVLAQLTKRFRLPAVLCTAACVLTVPVFYPPFSALAMTFSMGMLNASVQQVGPTPVSITYVTGSLVKFGQGLGGLLCGRWSQRSGLVNIVPWIGLLSGVMAAAVALQRYGDETLKALPIAAAVIAVLTLPAILWSAPAEASGRRPASNHPPPRGQ